MSESFMSVMIVLLLTIAFMRIVGHLRSKGQLGLAWFVTVTLYVLFAIYLYFYFQMPLVWLVMYLALLFTVQGGWGWIGKKRS